PEVGHQVRLVPHLEAPLPHLGEAVSVDPVLDRLRDQLDPAPHVLGRAAVSTPPEQRLGHRRQLARHEAQLDEWPDTAIDNEIEYLVYIAECVHGRGQGRVRAETTAIALPIHEHVVVKDTVKADVLKSACGDDLGELL